MVIMVVVQMVKKRRKMMVIVIMVDGYGEGEDKDSSEVVCIRKSDHNSKNDNAPAITMRMLRC